MKKLNAHAFRHHFIIRGVNKGVPVDVLSRWTGDTAETLVRNYYGSQ